jgi:hypothetical protein
LRKKQSSQNLKTTSINCSVKATAQHSQHLIKGQVARLDASFWRKFGSRKRF